MGVVTDFQRALRRYAADEEEAEAAVGAGAGQGVLWSYQDPDGNPFYLEVKKTTVKSPFSGKSFPARPKRHTPAQLGKELKDKTAASHALLAFERALLAADDDVVEDAPAGAGAGQAILWAYEDPDGNPFYLEVKKTTVKSPFSGKSFPARPKRHTPAQLGKELKDKTASVVKRFAWALRHDAQTKIASFERVALNKATVAAFLEILKSYLTQYDKKEYEREAKRGGGNIYRLSLLLGQVEKIEGELRAHLNSDTPDAMEALKASVEKNFLRNSDRGMNRVMTKLFKQIDAWTEGQKLPRLDKLASDSSDVLSVFESALGKQ